LGHASLHDALQVEVRLVDYGTLVTMEKLSIRNINDSSVWALPYQVGIYSIHGNQILFSLGFNLLP